MNRLVLICLLPMLIWSCINGSGKNGYYEAKKAWVTPLIDGDASDTCWTYNEWAPIEWVYLGPEMEEGDFSGRYKASWDENFIFILAEIEDDTLVDIHPDGLELYWDDDCLEIFVDEDKSGGDHQYNYNAFAYHVAIDYNVVDIGPDSAFQYYNDHVTTRMKQTNGKYIWEVAMSVYDDSYVDSLDNKPVKLHANKELGFGIAYCDNDYSEERENFIGSMRIRGKDKNRGWIDAGVFGTLKLVE